MRDGGRGEEGGEGQQLYFFSWHAWFGGVCRRAEDVADTPRPRMTTPPMLHGLNNVICILGLGSHLEFHEKVALLPDGVQIRASRPF